MSLASAKVMTSSKAIVNAALPLLAVSLIAAATHAQEAAPPPSPQLTQVAASKQEAATTYQCAVTTKDGVEKAIIRAASEDAAKSAAVQRFGARSTGLAGVSCVGTAGSAALPADSAARKEGVKTRAAAPTPFDPIPIRHGVEFLADGSCRLSQQAVVAHPDARQNCQSESAAKGVTFGCPAKYCETLK
jgi:hypothetical protein